MGEQAINELTTLQQMLPKALEIGWSLVWALAVLFIGLKVMGMLRRILRKALDRSSVDIGVAQFLDALVKIVSYVVLALIVMSHFGIQTASFITLLGTAGVAVGLSLKESLSNIAGGIVILLTKPFSVGNYIQANGHEGTVTEITLFGTILHTADNRNVVMPNGALANSNIVNYSANDTRRVDMSVGVAYGTDLKKAREIVESILDADEKVLKDPAYIVAVDSLDDSAITILVRPWVKAEDYWDVKWRTMELLNNRLTEAGIEIPFPQMSVHLQRD